MQRVRATSAATAGRREALASAAALGRDAAATRERRGMTQAQVAAAIGYSRTRYADLERGAGANAPLALWIRLGIALGRPLAVALSRDSAVGAGARDPIDAQLPSDGGHLAGQELVLRLARVHGRQSNVELSTGVGRMPTVADVVLRDDRQRVLILIEIVNRAGDLGALARSTDRKRADLDGMAILIGDAGGPYRVAVAWLFTMTHGNRRLVAAYPEFLRTRCPGSSVKLVASLSSGTEAPSEPAMAWIDLARRCLVPVRLRRDGTGDGRGT